MGLLERPDIGLVRVAWGIPYMSLRRELPDGLLGGGLEVESESSHRKGVCENDRRDCAEQFDARDSLAACVAVRHANDLLMVATGR